MTWNGGIKYSDPLEYGQNSPYDGEDIKSDRKGGWIVRHPLMGWQDGKIGTWIEAVPHRGLAEQIQQALYAVASMSGKKKK